MTTALKRIEDSIFSIRKISISNLSREDECDAYHGTNFVLDQRNIKFRKAKITPKKVGQFVTLWRRNSNGNTEPFNVNDEFDFYLIVTEENDQFGFFFFPKDILSEKQILTNDNRTGKRGFRVYPDWSKTENKQAEKTKFWQQDYFINLTSEAEHIQKFSLIFAQG